MNPVTYLCFTLMSILIQFCLMDFTGEKINNGNGLTLNRSVKMNSNEMLKRITEKPHALYYRTEAVTKKNSVIAFSNESVTENTFVSTTIDLMTIEVDDVYYNDTPTAGADDASTTDAAVTSTEYDNVTEITLLYKTSTVKPTEHSKRTKKQDKCYCDLSYQVCDVNCYCDVDCSANELKLFKRGEANKRGSCDAEESRQMSDCTSDMFERLFCVVKVNLPDEKDVPAAKADSSIINKVYKWHKYEKIQPVVEFKRTPYAHGDPLMIMKRGKLYNIDLPTTITNNYCKGSKPIRFLVNEDLSCFAELEDLHAPQILATLQNTSIVSFLHEKNFTDVNCTSTLCANWTVIVCDEKQCDSYNRETHEPRRSAGRSGNVAHRVEYAFYCNETGIKNATVRLYVTQVPATQPYVAQTVRVRFYMTNSSNDVITLSGNPGYIDGLPVIASYVQTNHTLHFYNSTRREDRYVYLPYNSDGKCVLNQIIHNNIIFGQNKQMNCRLSIERTKIINGSEACARIQERVMDMLRVNEDIFISPFGKPLDTEWVLLEKLLKNNMFGEYRAKVSQLLCFGIMTRFSFTFVYMDVGKDVKENKIVGASIRGTPRNLTLGTGTSYSVAASADVRFVDASGPALRVYAGAPRLRLHLPKNFFLPFY